MPKITITFDDAEWVLVPREPDKRMLEAGNEELREHCYTDGSESMGSWTVFEPWAALKMWEKMLSVCPAPKPPG